METMKQPVSELLRIAMNSLKELTDVNIIVGEKITFGNVSVVPISKVKCGFISGGVDQKKEKRGEEINPFGGGAGGNLNITPVAFLAFVDNDVKVLHLEDNSHTFEKIIDFIPNTIETIIKNVKKNQKTYTINNSEKE